MIFPSEVVLPAEIDWNNGDTDGLLTCQYDDGTTITNLLTGVTGEAFDLANLVGVAASSGERVSATWSSKPLGIDSDPFSLLQTQEDVQQGYGLVCDNTNQISIAQSVNASSNYTILIEYELYNDNTGTVNLIKNVNGVARIFIDYNHNISFASGWSTKVFTSSTYVQARDKGVYVMLIRCVNGDVTIELNGQLLPETLVSAQGFKLTPEIFDTSLTSMITKFNYTCTDFPTESRYWTFDQTGGDTVTDHINGAIATLVNFPADVTNPTILKWQPVISTTSFTLGALKDYANTADWYAANNNGNAHYILEMFEMEPNGFTTTSNKLSLGATFKANTGLVPEKTIAKVGYTGTLFISTLGEYFRFEGIGTGNMLLYGSPTGTLDVVDCIVDPASADGVNCNSEGTQYNFKRVVVKCKGDSGSDGIFGKSASAIDKTSVVDCLILNAGRFSTVYAQVINTIFYNAGNVDVFSGEANYCVTSRASLSGVSNVAGQDFTGAFVDEAQGDYRINDAWATANLKGKGWNNSDIAAWAYFIAGGLVHLTKSFALSVDLRTRNSKDFNIQLDLLKSLSKDFVGLTDLLSSLSASKDFNLVVEFQERISKEFNLISNLSQKISKDFQLKADLRKRLSKDFAGLGDLLQRKTKGFTLSVDFRKRLTRIFSASTDLLTGRSKDFAAEVDFKERNAKSFDFKTNFLARQSLSYTAKLELLQRVSKAFELNTGLLSSQSSSKDFNIVIDILAQKTKDFEAKVEFLTTNQRDFDLRTDLVTKRSKDFQANIAMLERQSLDFMLQNDFRVTLGKSFQFTTDFLGAQSSSKDFNLVVDLRQKMSKNFSATFDLLTRLTKDHELVATLLNKVTMDFVARFDLNSQQSKDFTFTVDYLERKNKSFNLVVRIDSEIIETTPAYYTIGIRETISFEKKELSITFTDSKIKQLTI